MKKLLSLILVCAVLASALVGCQPEDMEGAESNFSNEISSGISSETSIEEQTSSETESEPEEEETKEKYQKLSENFYVITQKNFSFPKTEKEKASFFNFIISSDLYSDEVQKWWNEETKRYEFPVDDVKKILFSSLNTDSFNPEEGFPVFNEEANMGYDAERQLYVRESLGGFGGAAAVEADSVKEADGKMTITLAVFDFEKYYNSPQEKIITEYCVFEWSRTDGDNFCLDNCYIEKTNNTQEE